MSFNAKFGGDHPLTLGRCWEARFLGVKCASGLARSSGRLCPLGSARQPRHCLPHQSKCGFWGWTLARSHGGLQAQRGGRKEVGPPCPSSLLCT